MVWAWPIARITGVGLLAVVALPGCGGAQRVAAPSFSPAAAAAKAIQLYDKSGDGKLDAIELTPIAALRAALPQIDTDADGAITQDELSARINRYDEQQLGALGVTCRVMLDGEPLGGAVVRLVPLVFLSDTIRPATGTTDDAGSTSLKAEGSDIAGVHCGLYRVEISRKDAGGQEQVPPKYNVQSELGQEVSTDTPGLERGITFELRRS